MKFMLINLKMWPCQRYRKECLCMSYWQNLRAGYNESQWEHFWDSCPLEAPGIKSKMRITKLITLPESRQKKLQFFI